MASTGVVSYAIPKPMRVRLELFDVLGRRLAVLDDGLRQEGSHQVVLDASDLPTGTYFCRFRADHLRFYRSVVVSR
jgi:hypothetical protein